MATKALNATRIGGHACSYLAAGMREGRVASPFRHGLSLLFEEESAPTYISVQTPAAPLHPWAIEVPAMPPGIAVGAPAYADSEQIHFLPLTMDHGPRTTDAAIHTLRAACHELRITPYTTREIQRAASNRAACHRLLDERRPQSVEAFEGEVRAVVAQWQTTGDLLLLASLVGLGSGSTPSGDDVLVGILAGLTALSALSAAKRQLDALRQVLAGVSLRTHPASWQMLAAAADGSFPEPLVDLVSALGDAEPGERLLAAATCVLALGATSGQSLLAGVLASVGRSWQFC
ncbi:MAG: DUF2877 domain-containing protein [Candidatus Bipolaricaulis sp.]|nr:DUF2877 domain-containing protein [Candidatus Bipolaricaulis sp.]